MRKFILIKAYIFLIIVVSAQNIENKDSIGINPPGTFKILNKNTPVIKIPFRMHNGKPLMDVEINNKKATLMIDNGVLWDEIWLFGSDLVEQLRLKPIDERELGGSGEGETTQIFSSSNLNLKFDDIVFKEQPVLVSPPEAGFASMFPGADGQLCNTFFKHFVVEFDFINNQILLHKPESYEPDENYQALKMSENENGTYAIPFSFTMNNKTYNDDINIDFGGIYAVKLALNNKYNFQLPENIELVNSFGAQGKSTEYKGSIESYTIGNYTFKYPSVIFGDRKTSRIHPNNLGVIGLPLFMKFNIVFDYFKNILYIKPNKKFDGKVNPCKSD